MLIVVLVLLIPLMAILRDSPWLHNLASRSDRRALGSGAELLADRVAYLEGEIERLTSEVRRLDDEGQFLHRLLLEGPKEDAAQAPAPPPAGSPAEARSERSG
jgi:hypothetical protein